MCSSFTCLKEEPRKGHPRKTNGLPSSQAENPETHGKKHRSDSPNFLNACLMSCSFVCFPQGVKSKMVLFYFIF